jgi:hypothetical protein
MDIKNVRQRHRYKVVVLTPTGKILTKEYQATSDGDARKKALMPMGHQSILLIRKLEE